MRPRVLRPGAERLQRQRGRVGLDREPGRAVRRRSSPGVKPASTPSTRTTADLSRRPARALSAPYVRRLPAASVVVIRTRYVRAPIDSVRLPGEDVPAGPQVRLQLVDRLRGADRPRHLEVDERALAEREARSWPTRAARPRSARSSSGGGCRPGTASRLPVAGADVRHSAAASGRSGAGSRRGPGRRRRAGSRSGRPAHPLVPRRPFQRIVRKRRRCGSDDPADAASRRSVASWTPTRAGAGSSACTRSRFASGEKSRGAIVRSAACSRGRERERTRTSRAARRRIGARILVRRP